jgi:glycosyltransferase involved in cell wall biosynthesis
VLDHLVSAEATARDRGESGGLKLRLLRLLDTLATGAADIVVVDTDESAARLTEAVRRRAVVVPVGATTAWFRAGAEAVAPTSDHPLRVVFFGSFTPLQGTVTLARAVGRLPEGAIELTLLGTGQDHDHVRRLLTGRRDVTWQDWVPIEQLPALVATHDVCLGVFGETEKALSVVPTKMYQGAAAGCALVTSDTAPHRRILQGAAVLVPPGDDAALAEALLRLAGNTAEVARLRQAAASRATAFAPASAVAPLAAVLRSGRVAGRKTSHHVQEPAQPRPVVDPGRSS